MLSTVPQLYAIIYLNTSHIELYYLFISLCPFQCSIFLKKESVSYSPFFLLAQNTMLIGSAHPFVVSGEVGRQRRAG